MRSTGYLFEGVGVELALFHDVGVDLALLHVLQEDVFLDRRLGDEAVDGNVARLADSVAAVLSVRKVSEPEPGGPSRGSSLSRRK